MSLGSLTGLRSGDMGGDVELDETLQLSNKVERRFCAIELRQSDGATKEDEGGVIAALSRLFCFAVPSPSSSSSDS